MFDRECNAKARRRRDAKKKGFESLLCAFAALRLCVEMKNGDIELLVKNA